MAAFALDRAGKTKSDDRNDVNGANFIREKLQSSSLFMPKSARQVLENVNVPGVNHITDEQTGKPRKAFWLFVVVGFFVVFLIHFGFLTAQYIRKPVSQSTQYTVGHTEFPDVTICHTGPYSYSRSRKVKNFTTAGGTWESSRVFSYGIKNFWKTVEQRYRDERINAYTRDDNRVSRLTMYAYTTEARFGHFSHEAVLFCDYDGSKCSFRNFTTFHNPETLSCFTYSPEEPKTGYGSSGLSLVLMDADRLNLMTELETIDYIRGFKVYVHERGTYPDRSGFRLCQVGTMAQIGYDLAKRETLDLRRSRCHKKPPRITFCTVDSQGALLSCNNFAYSIASCQAANMQRQVVAECGCLSESYPIPEDLTSKQTPHCHYLPPWAIKYPYPTNISREEYLETFVTREDKDKILKRHHCHDNVTKASGNRDYVSKGCHPACSTNVYTTNVATYNWPTDAFGRKSYAWKPLSQYGRDVMRETAGDDSIDSAIVEKVLITNVTLLKNNEYVQDRFARVMIWAGNPSALIVEESLAYPVQNYLSDFGGILGLWIGYSVITLVEVIEGYVVICCRRKKVADES